MQELLQASDQGVHAFTLLLNDLSKQFGAYCPAFTQASYFEAAAAAALRQA